MARLAMTTLQLVRQRLLSQQLLGSRSTTPESVVRWLGAVQAQDYSGAKWALGIRLKGGTDDKVEQAFGAGAILRTHLLRPTWHFVTAADIPCLVNLTAPHVHTANAYMYRKLGFDNATFKRSTVTLVRALQGGRQLTRDELRDALRQAGIATDGEFRMGYLLMHAELDGLVCSGPRRGKQSTYALLDERVPPARLPEREEALTELAGRFFKSRGPATVQDFAKWSGLPVAAARSGLEGAKHRLQREAIEGTVYWFAPPNARAGAVTFPTAHLLSIYDEYVSGYRDRGAMIDSANAARLSALGNALGYIVVVNGRIVGTWKRRFEKGAVVIQTDIFEPLTSRQEQAVGRAVRSYGKFLRMPVRLESR